MADSHPMIAPHPLPRRHRALLATWETLTGLWWSRHRWDKPASTVDVVLIMVSLRLARIRYPHLNTECTCRLWDGDEHAHCDHDNHCCHCPCLTAYPIHKETI